MGESAESTVLTFNRKASDKKADGSAYSILDCPSVIVGASNFVAKGITFENSAPKPDDFDYNSQAPAIRVSGDNCAFYDCVFLGWQDTLYADQGKHYYKDSRIEGNVDFILGYASAVFDNCTIYSRGTTYRSFVYPFVSIERFALWLCIVFHIKVSCSCKSLFL